MIHLIVMYFIFAIIGLIILARICNSIEKFYFLKYNYKIYKIQVLLVLFLVFILFLIFWMGVDGAVSYDNMMAAVGIGFVLWVLVFIYNAKKTSIITGFLLTIFQSIIAIFFVFIVILFIFEFVIPQKS